MITLDDAEALIAGRRTSLLVDRDRPVDDELLERLCRLVGAAPNHKRTAPWRIAVLTGQARLTLGTALAVDLVGDDPTVDRARVVTTREKYARAPAVVVVGCAPCADARRHAEDRAAVAAGVQNLLLGATAAGLASMWSSPPVAESPTVAGLTGWEPATVLEAVVYLGWPASAPPTAERAVPAIVRLR